MTVTDTPRPVTSDTADTPGPVAAVVSGSSPLANGFRGRFFAEHDYHRFHTGASSASRRHELERLYRDVRTGSLHPPNTEAVLEAIGAVALGQG